MTTDDRFDAMLSAVDGLNSDRASALLLAMAARMAQLAGMRLPEFHACVAVSWKQLETSTADTARA